MVRKNLILCSEIWATHSEDSLHGSFGIIDPFLHSGHITELVRDPSSWGSKHLGHLQEKYHWLCNNCCRLMVPNCGVV